MNDRSLIRMEKRATNHFGLFIVFLLTAIGLGVGGYLLYKNKDNIDFILPWDKIEYDEEEREPIIDDKKDNTSGGKLYLPEINPDTNIIAGNDYKLGLYITKIKATEKGYEITFQFSQDKSIKDTYDIPEETIHLTCDKILVDEYEVSPKFELQFNKNSFQQDQTTITIPIEELENLEIVTFNSLYFFIELRKENISLDTIDDEEEQEEDEIIPIEGFITAYQDLNVTNVKKIKKSYTVQNNLRISYYKKIEAEDATYLYFQVDNTNQIDNQEVELKKLVVNDKIYTKATAYVKSHYDSKNIFFIKIPRKDIKKVNNFTASFFITKTENGKKSIYSTNELTFDLTK